MNLQFGPYLLKRHERQLVGPDGPVEISTRSFDILRVLLERPYEPLAKAVLFDAAWPGVTVEENTLQVHVSALRKALGPSFISTVHGRGYKYAGPQPLEVKRDGETSPPEQPELYGRSKSADERPLIAVLPFENLSADPDQQYFSDGITGDIVDRLTRYRLLSVIGQHSSFALGSGDIAVGTVREKLKADFILTGDVRKAGQRVRIAARLMDTRSELTIWAEHYDRPLEDIFTVQDEVASIIANTLVGRVEIEVATRRPASGQESLTSHEWVLRGIFEFKKLTPASNFTAASYFEQAIVIHPGNALAHRWLSSTHFNSWTQDLQRHHLADGLRVAARALELDPTSAQNYTSYGLCQLWLEGAEPAANTYRRALSFSSSDPNVLAELGLVNTYLGDLPTAYRYFEQAFAMNPLPPLWYAEFRAIAAFVEGRYAEALPAFLSIPDFAFDHMWALACLGHLGRREQVQTEIAKVEAAGWKWNIREGATHEPFSDPEFHERLVSGIRKALL